MFSWSKKKDSKKRGKPEGSSEESEFGIKMDKGPSDKQLEAELKALAGVDSLPDDDLNLNEGEEDEESELLRLIGGGKGKRPPRKPTSNGVPLGDITSDITADIEEVSDEDVEVDENDEELLGELLELTQDGDARFDEEPPSEPETEDTSPSSDSDVVSVLKERLSMYKTAETKAKENNESSRARRFSRGIKSIEDMLKKAKAGKPVSQTDIPPPIALNLKPAPPVQPVSEEVNGDVSSGDVEEQASSQDLENPEQPVEIIITLMERLNMYKTAEAKSKENGETTRARRFNRGIKTIESLIKDAKAGKPVSPEDIPPVVALNLKPAPPVQPQSDENEEGSEDEVGNVDLDETSLEEPEPQEPERNIMDVLSERLQMYKTAESNAKENGETSRARRFGRGAKTLQDLIRQATAGKPIPPDDIPPPVALDLKPAPVEILEDDFSSLSIESNDLVRSSNEQTPIKFSAVDDDIDLEEEFAEEEIPSTVLEGLEQRLKIYTRLKEKAEEEGDDASVAQNEKIIRVYLNAITTYKNGGYVDVTGLPTPKGAPPIPIPFHMP